MFVVAHSVILLLAVRKHHFRGFQPVSPLFYLLHLYCKSKIGLSLRLRAQTLRGFCQRGLFAAGLRLRNAEDHARGLGAGLCVRGDGLSDE